MPDSSVTRHPFYETVDRKALSVDQRNRMQNQLGRIRHRFRRQTRRLSSPLASPFSRCSAIERIVDQSRTLTQILHRELMQYEADGEVSVMPPAVLHDLLSLNDRWIDRLENQTWLLENSVHTANELLQIHQADVSCGWSELKALAGRVRARIEHVPDSELLLHEPDLRLERELITCLPAQASTEQSTSYRRSATLVAPALARGVLTARFSTWLVCRSSALHARANSVLVGSLLESDRLLSRLPSGTRRRHGRLKAGSQEFHCLLDDTTQERRLIQAASHFAQLATRMVSKQRDRYVLPDLRRVWKPVADRFAADAASGRVDERMAHLLIDSLELNRPVDQDTAALERLVLFKQLRRHQPSAHRVDESGRVERQPVRAPRFLQRSRSHAVPTQSNRRIDSDGVDAA